MIVEVKCFGVVLVSYDDIIIDYVDIFVGNGVGFVEFLIIVEVVEVCWKYGIVVMMGVLNLICGGSYLGNVFVVDLVKCDLLDIVLFDYVLVVLLMLVFVLVDIWNDLFKVMVIVMINLVKVVGLIDCGVIEVGKCVDVICIC